MKKLLVAFALATLSIACGGSEKGGDTTPKNPCNPCGGGAQQSLYTRLGGKDAISAVVDQFVANVAADKRINHFFAKTDIAQLKMHLVNQICEASGGPCKYTGRSMEEAHKGQHMGVSGADFDALVEDLVAALDKFNVGEKEKKDLLGALGPMRKDIVEK
jgi:hemoglobin